MIAARLRVPPHLGQRPTSEVLRNAFFATFVMILLLYPLIDQGLHLGGLGAMNPILVYTILALGLNIVVGFAGLLDLGYAAFFAIGGYTMAFLTSPTSPLPFRTDFWVALVASWFVAALCGLLLGTPTLRLRGDYLAIVTLAFGEIVPRAFLNLEQWTHGAKGMNPVGRPEFPWFQITAQGPQLIDRELLASDQILWYYLIFVIGAITLFAMFRLRNSRLGRSWMAIREDEVAAAAMGVDPVRTKLLAFALGASFSGFAGSLFASMLQFIDPSQFHFDISIMVLSMVILGGLGNVWGVVFGGVVMGIFNLVVAEQAGKWLQGLGNALGIGFLSHVDLSNSKFMLYGLALVLLMLLRPEGIFPSRERRAELHRGGDEGKGDPEDTPSDDGPMDSAAVPVPVASAAAEAG